jgi:hypothetical protein
MRIKYRRGVFVRTTNLWAPGTGWDGLLSHVRTRRPRWITAFRVSSAQASQPASGRLPSSATASTIAVHIDACEPRSPGTCLAMSHPPSARWTGRATPISKVQMPARQSRAEPNARNASTVSDSSRTNAIRSSSDVVGPGIVRPLGPRRSANPVDAIAASTSAARVPSHSDRRRSLAMARSARSSIERKTVSPHASG